MEVPLGSDDQPDNPYQAPRAPYEPSIVVTTKHPWFLRTVFLQSIVAMIGVPLAWASIESIIFTLTGLFVTAFAKRCGNETGIIYGLSALLLALAVFILINYNSWSPDEAYWPVNQILCAYAVLALPIAILTTLRNANQAEEKNDQKTPAVFDRPHWGHTLVGHRF